MSKGTVLVTGGAGYIGSHAAKALHAAGYRVVVYDNLTAGHHAAVKYGELVQGDISDVDADALAVVTEWNEFREPDFGKMRSLMKTPVVFDGRNIYSPEHMRALGFTYFSIGR